MDFKMLRPFAAGIAGLILLLSAGAVSAQELVVNGGFETGALAPFTGATGYAVDASAARTGGFGLGGFNNTAGQADLTQTLATTAGGTYRVTAWAFSTLPGSSLTLGLGDLRSPPTPLTTVYAAYTFDAVAASANDAVHLLPQTQVGSGNVRIDDVSVVLLPPPASVPTMSEWAMILFGTILAGGAALFIQRRRFTV